MSTSPGTRTSPLQRPPATIIGGLTVTLAGVLVLVQGPAALAVWAWEGALAVAILLAATLGGYPLLRLLRLGPLPMRWRWLASAGLGVGLLSMLTLACGVLGWIGPDRRWVLPAVLAVFSMVGLVAMWRAPTLDDAPASAGPARALIVTVAPFLALVMLVATLPPGVIWQESGNAYDVLEYHLQTPKEYYQQQAITYLPHNVYASFPAAAEMLYLFAANAQGEPVDFWPTAQCLNALLAALFVAAAWLAVREVSAPAAVVAAVIAASTGWLFYLSGLAYVENGMLALGMLATAAVLRGRRLADAGMRRRWYVLAGLLTGLSCGFKYTAIPLVALPLLTLLWIGEDNADGRAVRRRLAGGLAFATAAVAAFAPWAIKNLAMTHNPVFPLAGNVFTDYPAGWGAQEARHFAEVHAPTGPEATLTGRIALLDKHILRDHHQRFGIVLWVMAAVSLVRRQDRLQAGLAAMVAVQLFVWLFATHLYARFAVPMLIPLLVLAGRGVLSRQGRLDLGFVAVVLVGISVNLLFSLRLYRTEANYPVHGGTALFTEGRLAGWEHLQVINFGLPEDARILMVGDARPFYMRRDVDYSVVFNRSPFETVVEESPTVEGIIAWFRAEGYTHVYVDWTEMMRLRRSRYGFPKAITMSLFEQLQDAGLDRVQTFTVGPEDASIPYATLFRVPDAGEMVPKPPDDSMIDPLTPDDLSPARNDRASPALADAVAHAQGSSGRLKKARAFAVVRAASASSASPRRSARNAAVWATYAGSLGRTCRTGTGAR